MANAYSAPNFNLDTATNVAGCALLKGSAIAITDKFFVFGGCDFSIEQNLDCDSIYLNDNSAANATLKYGKVTPSPGVTIRLRTSTVNDGLNGKTAVSPPSGMGYYDFQGSAGSRITVISNTAGKVSVHNARSNPNIFKYCEFQDCVYLSTGSTSSVVENVNMLRPTSHGFLFYAIPSSFLANTVTDMAVLATVHCLNFQSSFTIAQIQSITRNFSAIRSATPGSFTGMFYCDLPVGTSYIDFGSVLDYSTTQIDRIERYMQILLASGWRN